MFKAAAFEFLRNFAQETLNYSLNFHSQRFLFMAIYFYVKLLFVFPFLL